MKSETSKFVGRILQNSQTGCCERGRRHFAQCFGFLRTWASAAPMLAVLAGQAFAQSVNITPVGQWPGYERGVIRAVTVSGDYAYVAYGTGGMVVMDIGDPANPIRLGGYRPSTNSEYASVNQVAVAGDRAYAVVAGSIRHRLLVLDVSDPANPRLIGSYEDSTGGNFGPVAVAGHYAFLADAGITDWQADRTVDAGLRVLDVSDSTNLREVGRYNAGSFQGSMYAGFSPLAISGQHAFLAMGSAGLQVIDVSNPVNPRRVGSANYGGHANSVAVAGQYAYVADGGGVYIFDISNPAAPRQLVRFNEGAIYAGVAVSGNYAYVSHEASETTFSVIDISTPASPTRVASYFTGTDFLHVVTITGNHVFTSRDVIDISDPYFPRQVRRFDAGGSAAQSVAFSGNHAYVADHAGLQIIDVSQPASPVRVAGYDGDTPDDGFWRDLSRGRALCVAGNYAYLLEHWEDSTRRFTKRMQVLDISNPAEPEWMSGLDLGSAEPWAIDRAAVAVSGHYAYVPYVGVGLDVIDVSSPRNPQLVAWHETLALVSSVAVSGDHAYLALEARWDSDGNKLFGGGLEVVDIGDPRNPRSVGNFEVSNDAGDASGVVASGNHVYLSSGDARLRIIDVSNPANPRLVGEYQIGSYASVVVVGGLAYVPGWGGLHVIDISDPANPEQSGSGPWLGGCQGVAVSDDYAYVAAERSGLQVLRVDPVAPDLRLSALLTGNSLRLRWPSSAVGYALESSPSPEATEWQVVMATPELSDGFLELEVLADASAKYFRLRKP
jgi:hypothetical protein